MTLSLPVNYYMFVLHLGVRVTGFYCVLTVDHTKLHRIVDIQCLDRGLWINKMSHKSKPKVTNPGQVGDGEVTGMERR